MMLTIFTPIFNRCQFLERIYQSLITQNCKDFEWLIIDDGSTDDTFKIIERLKDEEKINIKYHFKENGGKHTAHNMAINLASGYMFICLDSDDMLAPDAVNIIRNSIQIMDSNDCGIIAYKVSNTQKLLSKEFDSEKHYGLFEYNQRGISGEFVLVFKTSIIKKYPFPIFNKEHFIGESVLYDRLELDGYKFAPLKKTLEICEYQTEGLSNRFITLVKNNPTGYCLYYAQRTELNKGKLKKLIMAGKYNCFKLLSIDKRFNYSMNINKIVFLAKPLGIVFYLYYKLVRGF